MLLLEQSEPVNGNEEKMDAGEEVVNDDALLDAKESEGKSLNSCFACDPSVVIRFSKFVNIIIIEGFTSFMRQYI